MAGFMSSGIALSVYRIADAKPVTAEKLRQFAFQSIDDLPEVKGWGWTSIEDMFDTGWMRSLPEKADFICFSLRVDTRRIPGGVLKKHLTEALREEEDKAAREGKKVSRGRKKELKELLAAKLLSQTEPVPSATEIALDASTGLIYVASNTASTLELFEQHFNASFGLKPECLDADPQVGAKVLRAIYEHGLNAKLDGNEYLLGEGGRASLAHPETGATVSAKDEQDAIANSLDAGMELNRLKVVILRKNEEDLAWELMLGGNLSISGLKTPKVESHDDDPDAAWLEKLYLVSLAFQLLLNEFTRAALQK